MSQASGSVPENSLGLGGGENPQELVSLLMASPLGVQVSNCALLSELVSSFNMRLLRHPECLLAYLLCLLDGAVGEGLGQVRKQSPPAACSWACFCPRGAWTDCTGVGQCGCVHWASVGSAPAEVCYPREQLPGASLPDLALSPSCPPADGFTPLMIASCSGGGLETGNSEEEEDAPAVISDFIYQGASLHNQTDRTGETALHLAARYSRSDAAKRLLEASADANIQDNMGRTPLHAAVSADAQGVFQVGSHSRALLHALACLPSFLVWPQSPDTNPGQSRGSWGSPRTPNLCTLEGV